MIHGANLAAASLLAAQRDRLPGFPLVVYVAERHRRAFLDYLSRCRKTEDTVQTRVQIRRRHDGERLVELVSRRAMSAIGIREVWHTGLIDVTASAEAESERCTIELERLQMQHEEQALRAASDTKDRFSPC